jgi:hypothetical protein
MTERQLKGEKDMDVSDLLLSGFIKVDTLGGQPRRDVITGVIQGRFDRPDMELQGGGTLGLNATNLRTLASAWGPLTEDWVGKEIELYVGKTFYNGQDRDSVLVRTISPNTAWSAAPIGTPRRKELDDDIPF